MTLSGTTIQGQSGPGSVGHEGVLRIPHFLIVKCQIKDTRFGRLYPSAEMKSVYSTAPTEWANEDGDFTFHEFVSKEDLFFAQDQIEITFNQIYWTH